MSREHRRFSDSGITVPSIIPAHETTGGSNSDDGGDPDWRSGSGLLAEGRGAPDGGRVHDDDPSRYLNDTSAVHHDDAARPDHDGDDHAPRGHHYDGRTHQYVLYSDFYLDIYDGSINEYDGGYDLDNYRG